jgi:hypothetical protein
MAPSNALVLSRKYLALIPARYLGLGPVIPNIAPNPNDPLSASVPCARAVPEIKANVMTIEKKSLVMVPLLSFLKELGLARQLKSSAIVRGLKFV